MTRAEQRLRRIRRLERLLASHRRTISHLTMVNYAAFLTLRKIRQNVQHLERRLKNGKQRDR